MLYQLSYRAIINILLALPALYLVAVVCYREPGVAGFEPTNTGVKVPCLNQLGDTPIFSLKRGCVSFNWPIPQLCRLNQIMLQHIQASARFLVRGFDNPIIAATTVSDNVRKLQMKRPIYFAFFIIRSNNELWYFRTVYRFPLLLATYQVALTLMPHRTCQW